MSKGDDLSPTGMGEPKNEISKDFDNDKDEQIKGKNLEVPDMIKETQPHPVLTPPWDTSDVQRDHFDKRWIDQQEKYKQTGNEKDPFDKIDQAHENPDRLSKDKGPNRD